MTEQHPDEFQAVRYHVWWPSSGDPYYQYNQSENAARNNYYGNNYTPHVFIDGAVDGGSSPSSWWYLIQSRYYEDPPLEITLGGSFDEDTRQGTLDITVHALDFIDWRNLKIRTALIESDLYWVAPNGSQWHHQTMRDMIPGALGIAIEIEQGETIEHSENFSCPSPLVPENCKLVVWVQADLGREVLQVARITMDELSQTSIDDDAGRLPGKFKLAQNYPNPFNASTIIDYIVENEGRVELAVYDLNGRKVTDLFKGMQGPGHHQVVWNGTDSEGHEVSSGIYFYRLSANGKSIGKRMLLLR